MRSPVLAEQTESPTAASRRLFVAWQDHESCLIVPVGVLVRGSDGLYEFRYLRRASEAERFRPFHGFPHLDRVYRAPAMFPFFDNRLMAPERADYPEYVAALGLTTDADPIEVLGRSTGRRATDSIELFLEPEFDPEAGRIACSFPARGIRYLPGAEDAIDGLATGDRLRLLLDRQNPVNPRAQLMSTVDNRLVGWLPDYLVAEVERVFSEAGPGAVSVTVEQIGERDGPRHFRLLCRLDAEWPFEQRPFSDPDFDPLVL